MKVIIADDEEKVCQLIHALVDWEALNMEVVAIVHNGIEALEAIKKYNPNIVITDIRMPGYDGLDMIRRAKEINSSVEFIIISGYRHFEYAQNAIKYGVKDYLLKPIKKGELTDTLNKIRLNYMEMTERLSAEEKKELSIKNNLDKLRGAFFTDILLKKNELREKKSLDEVNKEYHYHFKEGCFQIITIKVDGIDLDSFSNTTYVEDKLNKAIQDRLKIDCYDIEDIYEDNHSVVVLNYAVDKKRAIRKSLKTLLDELLLQKEIFEKMKITIGAGTVQENIGDLYASVKTAIWAAEQRIVLGINKVIEGEDVSSNDLADSTLFYSFNKQFAEAIDCLDAEQIQEAFGYLERSLRDMPKVSGHDIIQMAKEAMNLYLICMRQNKLPIKESEHYFDKVCKDIENSISIEDIFKYLIGTILTSFRLAVEEKQMDDNKPIREAKQYMKKHYKEPISLEIVSDVVGFNETYFSSLFKKETGITFSEYMIEVRMEKAKEYLKESNLSVAAICEEVGYSDIKHFTKLFTKYTNLKPNEYRKIYS